MKLGLKIGCILFVFWEDIRVTIMCLTVCMVPQGDSSYIIQRKLVCSHDLNLKMVIFTPSFCAIVSKLHMSAPPKLQNQQEIASKNEKIKFKERQGEVNPMSKLISSQKSPRGRKGRNRGCSSPKPGRGGSSVWNEPVVRRVLIVRGSYSHFLKEKYL